MYQYEKNHIEINNNSYSFEFDIRAVIEYKENYIVLLAIPFNKTEINNIYCLDAKARLIWQVEDLSVRYPELKKPLPYEQMGIKDDIIFDDTQMGDVKLDITNSNQMVRNGYSKEYKLTIDCAKQLCMVQNNNLGKIARKYFIYVEKLLKKAIEWDLIRTPERIRYKELCEELKKYYIRNKGREPEWYVYSNEADALNKICLGAKAKDIREYIEACDKNTREWLEAEYNTYLDELQKMDLMYLRMNFDKDKRYDLIKQGFKALYPNASFIVANKEKYLN